MASDAQAYAEIHVTLPDGAQRSLLAGATGADLAAGIAKSLAKKAIALKLNGKAYFA